MLIAGIVYRETNAPSPVLPLRVVLDRNRGASYLRGDGLRVHLVHLSSWISLIAGNRCTVDVAFEVTGRRGSADLRSACDRHRRILGRAFCVADRHVGEPG